MAAEQGLGAVIERYETDDGRRRRIFMAGVPLGAVVACLGVLLLVVIGGPAAAAGASVVPAVVCGLGASAFGAGVWQGWLSVTRPDEVFTLYEGGFVHAYADKSWAIGWEEITKVTDRGSENPLSRVWGWDVYYRIKLGSAVGGRRVVLVTGLTEHAMWLGEAVRRAVQDGVYPRPGTD